MQILLTILLIFSFQQLNAKPPIPENWTLTLNEEFNQLDTKIWNTQLETGRKTYRRSKCFFLDDNVQIVNGNLALITKREKLKLEDFSGKLVKRKYTSGLVNSFQKFKQRYGYFEARIKQPRGRGLWTAFWLMPDRSIDLKNPFVKGTRSTAIIEDSPKLINGKGMEIDIMEYLTQWKRKKYHWAAHWDGYKENLKTYRGYYKADKKFSDDFHTYGVYWDKDILIWYFDDQEIARLEDPRVADAPMYMILSCNLGGWATWRVENDKLPEHTLIDYVRVWSKT